MKNYVRDALGKDKVAFFRGAWSSIVGWKLSERVAMGILTPASWLAVKGD